MDKFSGQRIRGARAREYEQIAHYIYLLDVLPGSIVEAAHITVFGGLPAAQREDLLEQLRPFLSDDERESASADPDVLAGFIRSAEVRRTAADAAPVADPRAAMTRAGVLGSVASAFLTVHGVRSYFSVGVGSVAIDDQPLWVQELVGHESAPIDAGRMHQRPGAGSAGIWP